MTPLQRRVYHVFCVQSALGRSVSRRDLARSCALSPAQIGAAIDALRLQGHLVGDGSRGYDNLRPNLAGNDVGHVDEIPPPAPTEPTHAPPEPPPYDPIAEARTRRGASKDRRLLDHQVRRLEELEAMAGALEATANAPPRALPVVRHSKGKRPAWAVAMLSDLHYGEVVHPDASTFGNAYNVAIAEFRLARFFSGVAWLTRNAQAWADLSGLVLWLGGDLITGHIHEDLAETALAPIPAMLALEPLIEDGIRQLDAIGVDVQIVGSYGNHGRTTPRKRIETGAHHSYEWQLYQHLARTFPGRVIANPKAHQYLDLDARDVGGKSWRLHFTHGDDVKFYGGVGGVSIPLNKATDRWDRVNLSDIHHYAHFHQFLAGKNWVVNGSVIGYNDFAMSIKAEPEAPAQGFYVLDAERGRTATSPVWVSDADEEKSLW